MAMMRLFSATRTQASRTVSSVSRQNAQVAPAINANMAGLKPKFSVQYNKAEGEVVIHLDDKMTLKVDEKQEVFKAEDSFAIPVASLAIPAGWMGIWENTESSKLRASMMKHWVTKTLKAGGSCGTPPAGWSGIWENTQSSQLRTAMMKYWVKKSLTA